MKKILISVIVDLFRDDGTTVRPKRVAELLKNDYDVTIVTRSSKDEVLGDPDINVKVIKPSGTKLWNFKLISFIIRNKYDLIYCSNDWFGFLTYYILSKVCNYKIIFEAHSIQSEELKERKMNRFKVYFYQILEKFVIKNSDYVIALSENTYDFYRKYTNNIELVPVFIDENFFIANKKKTNDNKKVVGLIGPFDNFGNEYFLDFLGQNIDKFDNRINFKVIGNCNEKINHQRISYTGYIKDLHEYKDILSSLDGLLVPSKIATLGPLNKIIEAMACSVPVFTTPKGIVGLYKIEIGKEILVFEEDKLVQGLNDLIFNEKLVDITKNARLFVEKYYSKKANKNVLLNLLQGEKFE